MGQNPGEGSESLSHTAFQEGLCRLQLTNEGRIGKEKKKSSSWKSSTCGDVEGRKSTKPLRNCRWFDEDGEK